MKRVLFRITVAIFSFLIGIGIPVYWWFFHTIPDVPAPETLIGCNFEYTAECQINETDKKFWENEILSRFKEKPLSKTYESFDESYRLTLLPTFDAPITIRIWQTADEYFVITKKLSGEGGFGLDEFGKLSYEKSRKLSKQEWLTALKLIKQTSFWRMSPRIDFPVINDGGSWVWKATKEIFLTKLRELFQKIIFVKLAHIL